MKPQPCPTCGQVHDCPGMGVTPSVVVQILSAPATPTPTSSKESEGAGSGKIQDFSNRVSKKIKRLTGRNDENIQSEPE